MQKWIGYSAAIALSSDLLRRRLFVVVVDAVAVGAHKILSCGTQHAFEC